MLPHHRIVGSQRHLYIVDGFKKPRPQNAIFFLSHGHSDHYTGLDESWQDGLIYCSIITSRIVQLLLGVESKWICAIPFHESIDLPGGAKLTLLPANHCPGAAMLLFHLADGSFTLHTGDFRYSSAMKSYAALQSIQLQDLYLDTTYCHPKFDLPPQEKAIHLITQLVAQRLLSEKDKRGDKTLFLIATYTIGKENILLEVAQQTGLKIVVSERKFGILSQLDLPNFDQVFTTDKTQSPIRVVEWHKLGTMAPGGWRFIPDMTALADRLESAAPSGYTKLMAFVPTGWTWSEGSRKRGQQVDIVLTTDAGDADVLSQFHRVSRGAWDVESEQETTPVANHQDEHEDSGEKRRNRVEMAVGPIGSSRESSGPLEIYMVPYSEHSSFEELRSFVGFLRPARIIPTVYGKQKPEALAQRFSDLIDQSKARSLGIKTMWARHSSSPSSSSSKEVAVLKEESEQVRCPVCAQLFDDEQSVMSHVDACLAASSSSQNSDDGESSSRKKRQKTQHQQSDVTSLSQLLSISNEHAVDLLRKAAGSMDQAISTFFDSSSSHPAAAATTTSTTSTTKRQTTLNSFLVSSSSSSSAKVSSEEQSLQPEPKTNIVQQQHIETRPSRSSLLPDGFPDLESVWPTDAKDCPYLVISRTFDALLRTKSRLLITAILAHLFRMIALRAPQDLLSAVYLCSNRLSPAFANIELGVGGSLVSQVISEISGWSAATLRAAYKRLGDIGDVAYEARASMRTITQSLSFGRRSTILTVQRVYNQLTGLSKLKGTGSTEKKRNVLRELLVACRESEARYLIRTAIANLRIGAVGKTLVIALAHAFTDAKASKEAQEQAAASLKACFSRCPDYGRLTKHLLAGGVPECLQHCHATPGIPIEPMLGKITRGLEEITARFGDHLVACDCKYDGQRAQIHAFYEQHTWHVELFSRHLDNMTEKYPDLVNLIPTILAADVTSIIMDAEIVAVEAPSTSADALRILPFQTLSTRARRSVDANEVKVCVCVFAFDLMFLNNESLLALPFGTRRAKLQQHTHPNGRVSIEPKPSSSSSSSFVPMEEQQVRKSRSFDGSASAFFSWTEQRCFVANEASIDSMRSFLHQALEARCEGLMVKPLGLSFNDPSIKELSLHESAQSELQTHPSSIRQAKYEPARRSDSWLKVKKDYVDGLVDSLDLVPIAAWWGNGRKAGWLSPFLMACFDPQTERWEAVCKCMTGFTDAFYQEITQFYLAENRSSSVQKPYYVVDEGVHPSLWLEPLFVWEIRGADMTLSPIHKAGRDILGGERGVSIRFPRFIRVRDDKQPEDATTSAQVVQLYKLQAPSSSLENSNNNNNDSDNEQEDL